MLRNSLPEQLFVAANQRGEHSFRFPSARANENLQPRAMSLPFREMNRRVYISFPKNFLRIIFLERQEFPCGMTGSVATMFFCNNIFKIYFHINSSFSNMQGKVSSTQSVLSILPNTRDLPLIHRTSMTNLRTKIHTRVLSDIISIPDRRETV